MATADAKPLLAGGVCQDQREVCQGHSPLRRPSLPIKQNTLLEAALWSWPDAKQVEQAKREGDCPQEKVQSTAGAGGGVCFPCGSMPLSLAKNRAGGWWVKTSALEPENRRPRAGDVGLEACKPKVTSAIA